MLRPRRGDRAHRFVFWQVGLFFLAAGVWVGGLTTGRAPLTGVAIAILVVAMVLGLLGRRERERHHDQTHDQER